MIYKACARCGRIHVAGSCSVKRARQDMPDSAAVRFRDSGRWKRIREQIKARDFYICRVCFDRGEWDGRKTDLSVHHIVPIEQDTTLQDEPDNLITLCRRHHEDAEAGILTRDYLQTLAATKPEYPPGDAGRVVPGLPSTDRRGK